MNLDFPMPRSAWLLFYFAGLCTLFSATAMPDSPAQESASENAPVNATDPDQQDNTDPAREKWNTGWAVYLDNDLLVGQDGEYTGGFAVTLSGRRAKDWFFSLDPVLGFLNDVTGFSHLGEGPRTITRHSFELGATAFTPEDIDQEAPIPDDHPYAGLVFVNNVRRKTNLEKDITYQSMLSIGVLGSNVVPELQKVIHDVTGSQDPNGWDNQISDGGEPTARYTLLRQDLLYSQRREGHMDIDVKSTFGGSIGYVTQLQGGINWRWGRLTTPSWGFSPDYGEYVNLGSPVHRETKSTPFPHEFFVWGGLHARLRGYNAMLEGQFRDSPVTFDRSELRKLIGEASLGVTCGLQTGTRVSLGVRARTPEIEEADGARPIWGTLIFSQAY